MRKIVDNNDIGDASHHGGDSLDYINRYLTGADQSSTDPVTIATTTTFSAAKLITSGPHIETFADFKSQVSAPADQTDTTYGRIYLKQLDSNNYGLFYKTKIGGTITEVRTG